jgi:electron transfer flavoprotein beta subunit
MSAAPEPSDLVVLVSVRIDPTSGRATRSRADAAAVALAQKALGEGSEPWLCTAGEMPDAVARDYLAQGVRQLTRLPLGNGAGLGAVVSSLDPVCRNKGLVLAGPRGECGAASGLLPYALAQRLQRPVINEVVDLQREADGGWRVVQALARGARRSWRLEPGMAAVLVTSPRLAQREDLPQRHAWLAAQAGAIIDQTVTAPQSMPPSERATWTFEPARKQRRPLAAASTASGAARMAQATGSGESEARGGTVIREGSAVDKARALLEHLRKLSLVQPPA